MLFQSDLQAIDQMNGGTLSPAHWHTSPVAVVLRNASLGFPSDPMLGQVLPDIVRKAKRAIRLPQRAGENFKLQHVIGKHLKQALFPDSIPALLKRRFEYLQLEISYHCVHINLLKAFLKQLSPAWATAVLKTWASAWTTSARMHESIIRGCLFGCPDARDELYHYVRCQALHDLLDHASLSEPGIRSIAEGLLFIEPSVRRAERLVVSFLAYNAVKDSDALSV